MSTSITFSMIKPAAVESKHTGSILNIIEQSGFKIAALRKTQMTRQQAERFYDIHKEKPFYEELTTFMSSGPIIAMVLEKENAVEDFRQLIGATNPEEAAFGTIRRMFAVSIDRNAIHGSDSDENAEKEAYFFFNKDDIF